MKIIKIIGGLGNQMFQYALAIALQQQRNGKTRKSNSTCMASTAIISTKATNLTKSSATDLRLHR